MRLDTDSGPRGYGEMMMLGTGFRLPVLAAMMADIIEQAVIGHTLCSPNFLIMEAIERFDGVHARFVDAPFEWRDGYLMPPRGPGLGFSLRETWPEATLRRAPSPARSARTDRAGKRH
jgi:L-alanine-DL-glutamate epimerase-like enolase superfamily enzyme